MYLSLAEINTDIMQHCAFAKLYADILYMHGDLCVLRIHHRSPSTK